MCIRDSSTTAYSEVKGGVFTQHFNKTVATVVSWMYPTASGIQDFCSDFKKIIITLSDYKLQILFGRKIFLCKL